jgi:hypothetical protein
MYSLLNGPVHHGICGDERRNREKDLVPRAAHDVPEALCDESGHGALAVGRQRVRHDALARATAAFVGVTPAANVPSACIQSALVESRDGGCEGNAGLPGEVRALDGVLRAVEGGMTEDVRGLVSRVGIGGAAGHFVMRAGGVEGAIGGDAG